MRQLSEKTKEKQNRGTGTGSDYIPYCRPTDFNSLGTTTFLTDWISGRRVHLLSIGEKNYYNILRFDSKISDIQEQYPLELDRTVAIARGCNIRHPRNNSTHMTTDFLITYTDGHKEAHSCKPSKHSLDHLRTNQKLYLEKLYWESISIPFFIVFTDELDIDYANNIEDCASFYSQDSVTDDFSTLKHLIIHHKIDIPLTHGPLDYQRLIQSHRKELDQYWNRH